MNTIESRNHLQPNQFDGGDKEIFHSHKATLPAADQVSITYMEALFDIETLSTKIEKATLPEISDPYLLNPSEFKALGQDIAQKFKNHLPEEHQINDLLSSHQYNEQLVNLHRSLLLKA